MLALVYHGPRLELLVVFALTYSPWIGYMTRPT